jgi:hypothetical protein
MYLAMKRTNRSQGSCPLIEALMRSDAPVTLKEQK